MKKIKTPNGIIYHLEKDQVVYEKTNDCVKYYKNNKLHRDGDLPAIEYANGSKCWYKNGKRHRDNDKPAEINYDVDGKKISEMYYCDNKFHRANKPAIIEYFFNGYKKCQEIFFQFYLLGKLHRLNGPAICHKFKNGKIDKHKSRYYVNGRLHNTKGPAKYLHNNWVYGYFPCFYINGKRISEQNFYPNENKVKK